MNRTQEEKVEYELHTMIHNDDYAEILIEAVNRYLGMAHTEIDDEEDVDEIEKYHLHFLDKADEKWEDKKNS